MCTAIPIVIFFLNTFVVCSLGEQAEVQERQEQKVSELMEELEASNSDRSLKKKYKEAGKDLERVKSDLAQMKAEWVPCVAMFVALCDVHYDMCTWDIVTCHWLRRKKLETESAAMKQKLERENEKLQKEWI